MITLQNIQMKTNSLQIKKIMVFFSNIWNNTVIGKDISDAVDYAFGYNNKPGGIIIAARDEDKMILWEPLLCAARYGRICSENILVYAATDKNIRGKGIGKN